MEAILDQHLKVTVETVAVYIFLTNLCISFKPIARNYVPLFFRKKTV